MSEAFICDAIRTPIGAFGGSLSSIRTDDLAAIPLKALKERNKGIDWDQVDDLIYGCANQAGEDNRNVARMAALLCGPRRESPRHDCEPSLRVRHGYNHYGVPRGYGRRRGFDYCGRGRINDARAFRHAKIPKSFFKKRGDL